MGGAPRRHGGCTAHAGMVEPFISAEGRENRSPRLWRRHSRKGVKMTLDQATELIRHTLVLALLIAAPMLGIGLVVGIIISLFQAVTQVQEQTLTFVPKIAAMVGACILL